LASASPLPTRFRSLSDPESLRLFAQNLLEGIYITTIDGRILDGNPACLHMFGARSVEELAGFRAADLLVEPERRIDELRFLERDGTVREFELTIRSLSGQVRTVLDTCFLIRDPGTNEQFCHGILVDITGRKALEAKLIEMSTHDPLTGALNRHYLKALTDALSLDPDMPCGCVFVDIDHFKLYNDQFGHQAGDEVLVRMSRFLMRYVRAEEAVLRVGGDEFVVMLRGAGPAETQRVADRLREHALRSAPVPFSLGWAAREAGEPLSHVLDRADHGMLAVRVVQRASDPRQQLAQSSD
jgi:diguanylate cyclase (GGDEF)-like protein/PAS domain S-box-containing protein